MAPPAPPPPPYVIEVRVDRSGAVLSGSVPGEGVRAALIQALDRAGYGGRFRDEITVREGAPANFDQAARLLLDQLLRLDMGALRIEGTSVTLQGLTCRDALRQEVESAVRAALPAGFAGGGQVSLRQTGCATCQSQLDDVTRGRTILFQQGSAVISADAATGSLMDDIARVLRTCPNTRVQVEGHTNSDGSRERNISLSRARAEAVVAALAQRGLAAGQFSAAGFGPDRPLVPHGSEEARERNRRVQFTVVNP